MCMRKRLRCLLCLLLKMMSMWLRLRRLSPVVLLGFTRTRCLVMTMVRLPVMWLVGFLTLTGFVLVRRFDRVTGVARLRVQ